MLWELFFCICLWEKSHPGISKIRRKKEALKYMTKQYAKKTLNFLSFAL